MDLARGYGTIVIVTRWILAIAMAALVSSAGSADAQAFKPKKSTPAKGAAPAKKSTPAAKKAPAAKSRVVTSSKPAKKRTSRAAATSGRPDDLTPDDEPSSKGASKDEDYVLIEDDDE
jgi:hypothetical protein